MVSGSAAALLTTQADSAHAVAAVYTVSLLVTVPLVAAGIAAFLLRHSSAEARSLVWRSAIMALLLVFLGRQLPLLLPLDSFGIRMHWMAWVVPPALAAPLVELGRLQVASAPTLGSAANGSAVVRLLLFVYLAGVVAVLVPTMIASARARRRLRRATPVRGLAWTTVIADAQTTLGMSRRVEVFIDPAAAMPMTWGFLRPVVVLPANAAAWIGSERRMVLMHELSHVRTADWMFNLAGRVACAFYWFHPGAWWIVRGLRADCEIACDDRVIAAGVRRSDYAELLVAAAASLRPAYRARGSALALAARAGLRVRLAAVLDTHHDVRPLARGWVAAAAVATLMVAGPMSAVQLAPTRGVLTTLMLDARWESRAYAVLGLAQRADSVAVARTAAELDPNPRVRAWARYALGERGDQPALTTIIRER
jgi:beta-lactamase regulating signal transducer with metallopeptidase domain